jgi:carbonic anhydrase/acetyltransferase-like protein (isoleucine patch superfamily)
MKHNSARELARQRGPVSLVLSVLLFANLIVSTHSGSAAVPFQSHFIDPSAIVQCGGALKPCTFGANVYIGPFAILKAGPSSGAGAITIGPNSNVQDNTILDATNNKPVSLGQNVIIAHGASVYGGASIGMIGQCPTNIPICASFVGFNSEVAEDAIVERNAMVTHLAKVGRGVRIPSGRVVLPGVYVQFQSEVDSKTVEIVEADHVFMADVINVNIALAGGYNVLAQHPDDVQGISVNPKTFYNQNSVPPTLDRQNISNPNAPARIIGDVRFTTALPQMGRSVAVRADEGTPFVVGADGSLANFTTFHALKGTELDLGRNGRYGIGSLMHGGKSTVTKTGENFELGNESVFYSSKAGNNCRIGEMSFVADADLPDGTVIPRRVIVIGQSRCQVEWSRRLRPNPTISRGNRKR